MKLEKHSNSRWERAIMHIDADAFFASVEEAINPRLKGKPLIVGGRSRRGVVSSANYEARKFGVRSAMSMVEAMRRCPQASVQCSGFKYYGAFSRRMFEVCEQFSPLVQRTSVDEGYVDLSGCELMHGVSVRELAKNILLEVNKQVGISVSGGLSTNKTISKIASGLNKPHALTTIYPGNEKDFLKDLPIDKMPGIGPKTCQKMYNYELRLLGDIAKLSLEEVFEILGNHGVALWKRCQGIDMREVQSEASAQKSISKEKTFSQDYRDQRFLLKNLKSLCSKVLFSLREQEKKAYVLNLKIRYGDFKTNAISKKVNVPMDNDFEVFPLAKELFLSKLNPNKSVRLIGFGVSDLRSEYNASIFEDLENKNHTLLKAGDEIKSRFGKKVLEYGLE